jgi:hypothetical protein
VHGLVTIFLEVIALAIILLVVGLVAPHVLVIASRAIMAPIVLMMIVGLSIIAVALVALVIVMIFTTAMLMVARFRTTCDRKLSRFPLLWLLVLGNLLKKASCLVGCLTLLEEGNHLERVSRHCFVQVGKLVLVRLGLREEDLFTPLLRRRYVHRLMEVTTLEVARSCTQRRMNLCIGMRAGFLEVQCQQISWLPMFGIPARASRYTLTNSSKFAFVRSALFGHCFAITLVHLVRPTP